MLRELYRIREFGVVLCAKAPEAKRELCQVILEQDKTAEEGTFDFLPRPPLVFSRTETLYDRSMSSTGRPRKIRSL